MAPHTPPRLPPPLYYPPPYMIFPHSPNVPLPHGADPRALTAFPQGFPSMSQMTQLSQLTCLAASQMTHLSQNSYHGAVESSSSHLKATVSSLPLFSQSGASDLSLRGSCGKELQSTSRSNSEHSLGLSPKTAVLSSASHDVNRASASPRKREHPNNSVSFSSNKHGPSEGGSNGHVRPSNCFAFQCGPRDTGNSFPKQTSSITSSQSTDGRAVLDGRSSSRDGSTEAAKYGKMDRQTVVMSSFSQACTNIVSSSEGQKM